MATTPDPHTIQITLATDVREQVDELVSHRYGTLGRALADIIAIGLDAIANSDPISDAERTRYARSSAAMGRTEPKARTNGHTTATV